VAFPGHQRRAEAQTPRSVQGRDQNLLSRGDLFNGPAENERDSRGFSGR